MEISPARDWAEGTQHHANCFPIRNYYESELAVEEMGSKSPTPGLGFPDPSHGIQRNPQTGIQHGGDPEKKSKFSREEGSEEERGEVDTITPGEEKRLVRKMDLHIIPLVMVLYVFSFLDRSVPAFNQPYKC